MEGIEAIGIKYPRGRGILGIYLILCGVSSLPHVKVPDAKAAAEILEEFDVEVVNKTLLLFNLTTLPSPSESFLQDAALQYDAVYSGGTLNGRGFCGGPFIHRPDRIYVLRRMPCQLPVEDLNRDPRLDF